MSETRKIKLWVVRSSSHRKYFELYVYSNKPALGFNRDYPFPVANICKEELYKKLGIRSFEQGRMLVELEIKTEVLEYKEIKGS